MAALRRQSTFFPPREDGMAATSAAMTLLYCPLVWKVQ